MFFKWSLENVYYLKCATLVAQTQQTERTGR